MSYSYQRFFPYDREARPIQLDHEIDIGFFGEGPQPVPMAVMRRRERANFYARVRWPQSVNVNLDTFAPPVEGEEDMRRAFNPLAPLLRSRAIQRHRGFVFRAGIVTGMPVFRALPVWRPRTANAAPDWRPREANAAPDWRERTPPSTTWRPRPQA